MNHQNPHDSLSIKYLNQGLVVSPTNTIHSTPLNVNCPYHSAILQLAPTHPKPEGSKPLQRLECMPPAGFSQDFRVGTSASGGCTCGHMIRADMVDISRELEAIVEQSANKATVTTPNRR
ncbi:uncharacterized protein K460DRAFT_329789 [Cucurbitaria berberidis CBS 394.84]|uniref:Uncharacterized protein n=1 Tax=Cucurbitaria berberidis CBS 394.84 TaxID=1168544 RepID=A0A9P4LA86_9PLEO|nr:uncharacterized protein K460DRAFT_329789 [Cucurbitaria berberidis CBS 394.84]KAF1846949.1 hypothetical protein K460DRAFT_329789 [Cucurbitaria berberidis CBS 394.84]